MNISIGIGIGLFCQTNRANQFQLTSGPDFFLISGAAFYII